MSSVLTVAHIESLRSTLHNLRRLLTHEAADVHLQVVTQLRRLFEADSGALFLQPCEKKGSIRLVASEPRTPNLTLELKISTEPGAGLTGFLATLGDVKTYDFKELRDHLSRANRSPNHLTGGKCCSMLAIPLRDERGFLIALLKFENKLGPAERTGEDYFFTEEDKLMAQLISEPVATLIESSIRRSALLDLSRKQAGNFSGEDDCLDVLRACVSLLYADRAELVYWNGAWEELVMVKHTGAESPKLREGQLVPRESAIYVQWSVGNSFFIVPKEKLGCDDSAAMHPASRSEVVFLCRARGRAKAILNIESREEDWFRENHRPLLELLEAFIIQAIQKIETRNVPVEQTEWPPCLPGFGWFRVLRRFDRDQKHKPQERLHWSVSPSCAEMFGLAPTATKEDYLRWIEPKMGQALEAAIMKAVLEDSPEIENLSRTEFKIYPGSRRPKIVKFFGRKSGFGEVQCILLDITEERIDAKEHMEKILPWLRIGFSEGSGKYVQVTSATARMYGYKNLNEFNETIQNAYQIYFDPSRRETLLDQLEKSAFVENFEFAAKKAGETGRGRPSTWISQDVLCLRRGKDRNEWRLMALFHDISDRKAMERKLCLAGVAGALLHETKRPFENIKTDAGSLCLCLADGDFRQGLKIAEEIIQYCDKCVGEANHWLQIAKGKKDPDLVSQGMMNNLKAFAAEAKSSAELDVQFEGGLPMDCSVTYNTQLMGFAFQQLFRNVKAGKSGKKRCTVRVQYVEPVVTIMVEDDGPGFGGDLGTGWRAIAELDRRSSETAGKGGLGLVMCNAVVEIHHGEMCLSDWTLADGTTGGARVTLTFRADQVRYSP